MHASVGVKIYRYLGFPVAYLNLFCGLGFDVFGLLFQAENDGQRIRDLPFRDLMTCLTRFVCCLGTEGKIDEQQENGDDRWVGQRKSWLGHW